MPTERRISVVHREMVLASAGSGKTFRLSTRLIGLLAADVPPQEILASTFTRKAAGEIVDRVLLRMARGALDPTEAGALGATMPRGIPTDRFDPAGWGDLLVRTARALHRLQVYTLDAFFHRVATSFAQELGLPERWTIAGDPDRNRLRARAVEATLEEMDRGTLLELVRLVSRGGADRNVQGLLVGAVADLHRVYRELDPNVDAPWGFEGGAARFGTVTDAEVADAIDGLAAAELPRNKDGSENQPWVRARSKAVEALRDRDWGRFYASGLGAALIEERGSFGGKAMPHEIQELAPGLARMARATLGPDYHRRVEALGRFLPQYDRRLRRVMREEGMYDFDDLTHALVEGGGLGRREELYYRLDSRIRHVLLDEFQDTSNGQWAALEPLVGEILSGHEGDRAAFIVADPKQSIYGWRGGEPRILDQITERYGLVAETLARNWRSSQIVLDVVNQVFESIDSNPVLEEDVEVARRWRRGFESHRAANDLPGTVRVEVGPGDEGQGGLRPRLLRRAAELVRVLHREAPGATIGILTRTNRTAAHLIALLRRAGLEASEEGGVPISDSEPVLALLALLRMTDHPGDTISRYLVAHTPVGEIVGFGPESWTDERAADRVAGTVRRRLLQEGYGPVVSDWVRALTGGASGRDRRRLRKLAELAFAWDPRATLRPTEFVHAVEAARSEDPSTSAIRVMTIHRAKGLEFDAVVLPELDSLSVSGGGRDPFLPYRPDGAGPVTRVFPAIPRELRPLFPEVSDAFAQSRERDVRDGLSALYVALTRARHAIYAVVRPEPERGSSARNAARVLTAALAPGRPVEEGAYLWESGEPAWWEAPVFRGRLLRPIRGVGSALGDAAPSRVRFAIGPRRRLLSRRTPSELEGGDRLRLAEILRTPVTGGREEGTAVHAWLESIEWVEDGVPSRSALLELANERAPGLRDPDQLLTEFLGWIEAPAARNLLSAGAFPEGTRVQRELTFVVRDGDRILQGSIDRAIRVPHELGARILAVDWKTDDVRAEDSGALAARTEFYRPQLQAYLRALSVSEGVPSDRMSGVIVFLRAGVVREISPE